MHCYCGTNSKEPIEIKPHSYGENMLTCVNLHMSRFAHVSKSKFSLNIFYFIIRNGIGQKLYNIMIALSLKSKFAMRSDETCVPWANTWNIIWN